MKVLTSWLACLLCVACAGGLSRRDTAQAPTGSISGVVRDSAGRPVRGAIASARRPADHDSLRRFAQTDSLGGFAIRGLPRGFLTVTVTSFTHASAQATVEVGSAPGYLAMEVGSSSGIVLCTMDYRAGMAIRVYDLWSGRPAAEGAVGWAVAGSYRDSLRVTERDERSGEAIVLGGAHEHAGEFTVTITRPGYQPWQQPVNVRRGDCHVATARLRANLVPLRPGADSAASSH